MCLPSICPSWTPWSKTEDSPENNNTAPEEHSSGAVFLFGQRMKLVRFPHSVAGRGTPAALPLSMHRSSQAMFRARFRMV